MLFEILGGEIFTIFQQFKNKISQKQRTDELDNKVLV